MPAARGFMLGVENVGTFINPADSAFWLDWEIRVLFVGADHRVKTTTLHVQLDPTSSGASMQAALAAAIVAFAAGKGYTIGAGDCFIPPFNKV